MPYVYVTRENEKSVLQMVQEDHNLEDERAALQQYLRLSTDGCGILFRRADGEFYVLRKGEDQPIRQIHRIHTYFAFNDVRKFFGLPSLEKNKRAEELR